MTDFIRAEYVTGVYIHRAANVDINGTAQGSAIVSAVRLYDGREVGGQTYYLSYSNITATHFDITIACSFTGNAQHGRTVNVARDGTTVYTDVIRGWGMVFSASGAAATSWKSTVFDGIDVPASCCVPGNPEGLTWDFTTTAGTLLTAQGAGAPAMTGIVNHRNVSGQLATGVEARLLNASAYKPTGGAGLLIWEAINTLVPKLGSAPGYKVEPYMITFEGLDTVPTPDTITVLIDGVAYAAIKVTGGEIVTTENVERNGVYPATGTLYQLTASGLANGRFIVDATAADDDEGEVRVWPVQYQTHRNAITGGAFVTTAVPLHAAASPAGEIPNNGVGQEELRAVIPAGAGFAQSPVLSLSTFIKAAFTIPSGA